MLMRMNLFFILIFFNFFLHTDLVSANSHRFLPNSCSTSPYSPRTSSFLTSRGLHLVSTSSINRGWWVCQLYIKMGLPHHPNDFTIIPSYIVPHWTCIYKKEEVSKSPEIYKAIKSKVKSLPKVVRQPREFKVQIPHLVKKKPHKDEWSNWD